MKVSVLCICLVLFALPAFAVTYTWVDDQGTVNFTEDLGNVPAKYRKKAKIVGEDEFPPPEAGESAEKPPAKSTGPAEPKEGAPEVRQERKNAVYGGKDARTWKSEFAAVNADVKAAEKQLVEYRNRLNDTSGLSRSDYLSIQASIKAIESSVLERRNKLDALKKEAESAGVPADLME